MFSFLRSNKAPESDAPAGNDTAVAPSSLAGRLKQSLSATRDRLGKQLTVLLAPGKAIDEALFEELETVLLTCDVGVDATQYLVDATRRSVKRARITDAGGVRDALKTELLELLTPLEAPLQIDVAKPFVILLAGVNGAGKTTSIGKLTKQLVDAGLSVVLAAGDTFRAAAEKQLRIWGERNEVTVIAQEGGGAAAVIFDAIQSAKSKGSDVVLADTAGRGITLGGILLCAGIAIWRKRR